jgi:hypothetical protein
MALGLVAQAHAAGSGAMAQAAGGFYSVYETLHPSSGIPGAKGLARYAPHISPRLNRLLANARTAEEKFTNAYKDSPPLMEGDIFTSLFEGATSYEVGECTGDGKSGHCSVALTFDPRRLGDDRNKPVHWTDTAYLMNGADGWKVDDIGYGGSWDFSNKGKLSQTLQMTIATTGGGG